MAYCKEVYQATEDLFGSFRFDAANRLKARKKDVFNKVPRLLEIDKELTGLGLSLVKKALMAENPEQFVQGVQRESDKLRKEQENLLVENGYAADYLEAQYRCSVCMDKGRTDDGYCDCFKAELKKEAMKQSGLPLLMEGQSFDNFKLDVYPEDCREEMQDVFAICKKYAVNFAENNGASLFLYGATGLGKTFLSSCVAKEVILNGFDAIYMPAYKIFRTFESFKFNHEDKEDAKRQIERITNAQLLVIDDLGAEMVTAYSAEVLFDLINTRINQRQATIISTNLDFSDLETVYSQRITSRILGHYIVLSCSGEDIREL
ncbi:MAG: ATP-binding protein [Clostridia bacterium]|nr:ATP-binding protein [Clostridia bacterium]